MGELVEHDSTGILVPAGDVEDFARALARLLEDSDSRARMGAAGRRRVQTHFDLTKTAHQFEAILEDLAGRRSVT